MSVRGNTRTIVESARAAKSRAYRLLSNANLRTILPTLIAHAGLVTKDSVIAIDFSHFKQFQVLMFAIQTKEGRAIPIFFTVLTYPIEKDSQNLFVIEAIETFVTLTGLRPLLVFDRGFACPAIIKYLAQHNHRFVIRLKGGKHVAYRASGKVRAARHIRGNDVRIHAYGLDLRLVTSDNPKNGNEPWYLLTNNETGHSQ